MQFQQTQQLVTSSSDAPLIVLTEQEARCVETLSAFADGDEVLVIQAAKVRPPYLEEKDAKVGLQITQTFFIKRSAFTTFAERLSDVIAGENPPAEPIAP
jgi:hypothetical protein